MLREPYVGGARDQVWVSHMQASEKPAIQYLQFLDLSEAF